MLGPSPTRQDAPSSLPTSFPLPLSSVSQLRCLYQALSPVSLCICLSLSLCLSDSVPLRLRVSSFLPLPSPKRQGCPIPLRGRHSPVPPFPHPSKASLTLVHPDCNMYPWLTYPRPTLATCPEDLPCLSLGIIKLVLGASQVVLG